MLQNYFVATLVQFYKDLNNGWEQTFNSGTILSTRYLSTIENHTRITKLKYLKYKEDIENLRNELPDYSRLHGNYNVLESLNEEDKIFLLKVKEHRNQISQYEDIFRG